MLIFGAQEIVSKFLQNLNLYLRQMPKRVIAFLMMGQVLFASLALPLGDFSLLKQLPGMYRAYEKVAAPDERGILDFVGDYLLNGKGLLGHNKADQQSKTGELQFQRAVANVMLVQTASIVITPLPVPAKPAYSAVYVPVALSEYYPSLFRPPLA